MIFKKLIAMTPNVNMNRSFNSVLNIATPLVGTHRGISQSSTKEIENTLSAFYSDENAKADFIECDVMITRDNQLILFHDENLNNTIIEQTNLEDIKRLIPSIITLADLLIKNLSENKIKLLNIELKTYKLTNEKKEVFTKELIELLTKHNLLENVMISSFDQSLLKKISIQPNKPCLALIYDKDQNLKIDSSLQKKLNVLCPHIKSLSALKNLNLPKIPWEHSSENSILSTLSSEKDKVKWVKKHKIIGLTTNYVEKTAQLLRIISLR
tara:strand:+ start:200 stop:1006 length:807 start_codon:yes stop_codon:yes gene_type:complete